MNDSEISLLTLIDAHATTTMDQKASTMLLSIAQQQNGTGSMNLGNVGT